MGSQPCNVSVPSAWMRAKSAGQLWHGAWVPYAIQAPTPEGTGVLAQSDADAAHEHVAIIGHDQNVVEDYGTIPRTTGDLSQITFDSIDSNHLAFVFSLTNGDAASWRWRLYLGDRHNHQLILVASNPTDGHGNALHGGWVHPVLTDKYLYWIQAAPDTTGGWGGSELMQYTLATGKTRRLYRGLVESFVPYGNDVLLAALTPGTKPPGPTASQQGIPETIQAFNQGDGTPAAAPSGIALGYDGADFMETDGDIVIWDNAKGALLAWRPQWGKTVTILPSFIDSPLAQKLGMSNATMPRLVGHFVIFQTGEIYVLDLKTNSFARLTNTASGEDLSGSALMLWELTSQDSYNKATGEEQTNGYVMNLSGLPDLPGCP